MKKLSSLLLIVPFLFAISSATAHDAEPAIPTMAKIIEHLQHYPATSEKEVLQHIIDDTHTTAGERTLARALLNMQHQVIGDDAAALKALKENPEASANERELADILLGIAHMPSASDQQRLKKLAP